MGAELCGFCNRLQVVQGKRTLFLEFIADGETRFDDSMDEPLHSRTDGS